MNKYIEATRETEKEVLTVLGELGYKWLAGEEATGCSAFKYTHNSSVAYIIISERGLFCASLIRYIPEDYDEITLDELKRMKYREVSNIKDLHNLENKDGTLRIYETNVFCLIDRTGEVILTIRKINQDVIDMLNSKGFNLIYKPVRTKEEILDEIDKLASVDGEYYIKRGESRFYIFSNKGTSYPKRKGLTNEDAKRLREELNKLEEWK